MPGAQLRISSLVLASLLLAASANAVNFVSNGDFDTSLADWNTVSPEPLWLAEDWQGDSQNSGSARIRNQIAQSGNSVYLMQCIALDGATELRVRAGIRSESVGGATGSTRIALAFRDGLDCDTAQFLEPYTFAIDAPEVADWTLRISEPITPPQGAVAAMLQLVSARHSATGGWIADFDDVHVPEPGAASAPTAFAALVFLRRRRSRNSFSNGLRAGGQLRSPSQVRNER
jgi:hypothetical protein